MVAKQTKSSPMKGTDIFDFSSNEFDSSLDFFSFFVLLTKGKWLRGIKADVRSRFNRSNIVACLIMFKLHNLSSVRQLFTSDFSSVIKCGKDVIYSVKNNSKLNWRGILMNQFLQCENELESIDADVKDAHQVPCFIVDDTDIPKRGKCMEMIGKIFSHVEGSYPLGFKNLIFGYWSDKTILFVDFSTHIEARKNGMQGLSKQEITKRYSKTRPTGSHGSARIQECLDKKTDSLIAMLKRVLKHPVKAQYLLADSWFFNSQLVKYIKTTSLQLLTRPKLNQWLYHIDNKSYTIGQLIKKYRNHKQRKFSRKLKMYTITLTVSFQGEPLKMYLHKPPKRGSKWQVLISTHRSLSAIRAYKIYQNRWAIEVSFKELNQQLNFGKCQSRDFVGQIADHTICLLTYNLLSAYKCKNHYQTIGALFKEVKQEWVRPTVMQKFWDVLNRLVNKLAEFFDTEVDHIRTKVLTDDPILAMFNLQPFLVTTET